MEDTLMIQLILGALLIAASLSHADSCFIDGANVPRCLSFNPRDQTPGAYQGVSWPVFTADSPLEVLQETDRRYGGPDYNGGVIELRSKLPIDVKHVRLDTPEHYPDVVCFDFYHQGVKRSQTCFDTMEITER